MAAEYRVTWLVKVYASSGTAKRQERERFYNNEIPYLLKVSPPNMIVRGDYLCTQSDSTGHFNYSKALDGLVRGFKLQVMWRAEHLRTVFTHYSPMETSRIDRIYTTKEQSGKKIGVETGSSFHRPPISDNAVLRRCPHRATGQGILENEHFHS